MKEGVWQSEEEGWHLQKKAGKPKKVFGSLEKKPGTLHLMLTIKFESLDRQIKL